MNYSEILVIVRTLIQDMTNNFWWQLFLTYVASFLGVFTVAYFKKYGENLALNNNFKAIREQLKLTTDDTEKIKQQLSGRAWRSQQQWAVLEKCYNHLLTNLHHLKVALVDLSYYYFEPGSEHVPDQNQNAGFNRLLEQMKTSYCEVEKVRGASAMFLSDAAVESLDNLFETRRDLAFGNSTAEYVFNSLELVKTAYDTILSEAKTQLAI